MKCYIYIFFLAGIFLVLQPFQLYSQSLESEPPATESLIKVLQMQREQYKILYEEAETQAKKLLVEKQELENSLAEQLQRIDKSAIDLVTENQKLQNQINTNWIISSFVVLGVSVVTGVATAYIVNSLK